MLFLFILHRAPQRFFLGSLLFGLEHFLLRATGSAPFLPSDFFAFLFLFTFDAKHFFFKLVAQVPAGEIPIGGLQARLAAFDSNAGRFVAELNTGGGLIDFLPAFAGPADKLLRQIRLADVELFHALMQRLPFLLSDHGKRKSRPNQKEQRQKLKFRLATKF
jgi:hypothetical protein